MACVLLLVYAACFAEQACKDSGQLICDRVLLDKWFLMF